MVSCGLRAVQVVTHVPLRALMLLVLLMSDFMGLVSIYAHHIVQSTQ